jgi:hypothetical protein
LVGIVTFYSVRKRWLQEKMPGTMMAWLKSHIYLAFLALGLILVHGFLAIFNSETSSGGITLGVFALLIVSGVAWRIVYVAVPPVVSKNVGNLAVQDTRSKAQIVQIEMDKLLAGKSADFRRGAAEGIKSQGWKSIEATMQLTGEEEAEWNRLKKMAERIQRYHRRERLQSLYGAFMQGWKWLHIPLVILFVGLIAFHIFDVFKPEDYFETNETTGLPPAHACARCHQDIVEEWELSMHSEAQTGPVVVAQTRMALEKSPAFGRACNNCHAPIGTALTQFESLPLDEANKFRSQENGAIIDDGVTCIVCHTLAEVPAERRGMSDNFPVVAGGLNFFADMFGPPLGDASPLPNTWHNSQTGFMTDSVSASRLCGTCHNVKVDINGDGEVTIFKGSDSNLQDSDGDNILDENELDFDENGLLRDLVLQTTFDEWEDYVAAQQRNGLPALGCVDCHMPRQQDAPIVTPHTGIPFFIAPDRERHLHSFIGVDYDLVPGRFTAEQFETIQTNRTALLQSAAELSITTDTATANQVTASITVRNILDGHNLPTGFAFARQMWLEVSAQTADGTPVCLTNVNVNGTIIVAQCASGVVATPQSELKTCNPLEIANIGGKPSKNNELLILNPASVAPLTDCDPWLANFQKVLTRAFGKLFIEEAYQSPQADIVKTRVRVSDGQAMDALNTTRLVNGEVHDTATFDYVFDVSGLGGREVTITAVLHFRHLPPYFLRALEEYYPAGITADDLLANLTIVDMARTVSQVSVP